MTELSSLLADAADVGVSTLADGDRDHMPAGHNGPWNNDETPLRNTGHWAILLFDAYERTGDGTYYDAATDCVDYLCRDEARPHGHGFHHRDGPVTDRSNGLVGQAWSIETLAVADRHVPSETPRAIAEEVFLLHPFDEETGLWRSVELDGTVRPPFGTINQQLWFAAAGSLLCRGGAAPDVERRITAFLDDLPETVRTYGNGIVYHSGYPYTDFSFLRQRASARLRSSEARINVLSTGYHSFNLYALGVLRRSMPDHPVWASGFVDRLLEPVGDIRYKNGVADNVFSFTYNPTGIEVAFALDVFRDGDGAEFWLNEQFRRCYDPETRLLDDGWDPATLAARLYEATRLRDRAVTVDTPRDGLAVSTPVSR
jgi:hypothetical protein